MNTDIEQLAVAHISRCPECARAICTQGHNLRVRVVREVERWLRDRQERRAAQAARADFWGEE